MAGRSIPCERDETRQNKARLPASMSMPSQWGCRQYTSAPEYTSHRYDRRAFAQTRNRTFAGQLSSEGPENQSKTHRRHVRGQTNRSHSKESTAQAQRTEETRPTTFSCPCPTTRNTTSASAPPTDRTSVGVAAASESHRDHAERGPKFSTAPKTSVEKKKKPKAIQVSRN